MTSGRLVGLVIAVTFPSGVVNDSTWAPVIAKVESSSSYHGAPFTTTTILHTKVAIGYDPPVHTSTLDWSGTGLAFYRTGDRLVYVTTWPEMLTAVVTALISANP